MSWHQFSDKDKDEAFQYICGYCSSKVASSEGYQHAKRSLPTDRRIYICPYCENPTLIQRVEEKICEQVPGIAYGNEVEFLPEGINSLYREARKCISVGSHTSSVLTCRKLLMHIAVAKGAEENQSFLAYVEHITKLVPTPEPKWIDHIRTKGNEANHDICLMTQSDAEELIIFIEMLLKFFYEFPNRMIMSRESA